jgi:hypothetical protein
MINQIIINYIIIIDFLIRRMMKYYAKSEQHKQLKSNIF